MQLHDGPRDCHTEWSKSDTERQITYDIAYMWNLNKWHKWIYLPNRVTDVKKQTYDYQEGMGMCDKLGYWDWHIHTTIYKINN